MSTPDMKSPLNGCTTIDDASPDGYLANARAGNRQAGANANTRQAASNLLSCATSQKSPGPANLVGHGQEGDIDTGKAIGHCIRYDNVNDWRAHMATLNGKVQELFLFGCTVGAGQHGADLLFELAKTVNAPVSAPTGLIYCTPQGDFYLHSGASWQTATPTKKPMPIQPPTATQATPSMDRAELQLPGGRTPAKVVSAVYTPYNKPSLPPEPSKTLASHVAWDQAFTIKDEASGKVTGHFEVAFKVQDAVITRNLYVLADHILRDGDTGYPVTQEFLALLGKK